MGAGLLHFAGLAQVARDTALEASVPFRFDPGQLHPRATSISNRCVAQNAASPQLELRRANQPHHRPRLSG